MFENILDSMPEEDFHVGGEGSTSPKGVVGKDTEKEEKEAGGNGQSGEDKENMGKRKKASTKLKEPAICGINGCKVSNLYRVSFFMSVSF